MISNLVFIESNLLCPYEVKLCTMESNFVLIISNVVLMESNLLCPSEIKFCTFGIKCSIFKVCGKYIQF